MGKVFKLCHPGVLIGLLFLISGCIPVNGQRDLGTWISSLSAAVSKTEIDTVSTDNAKDNKRHEEGCADCISGGDGNRIRSSRMQTGLSENHDQAHPDDVMNANNEKSDDKTAGIASAANGSLLRTQMPPHNAKLEIIKAATIHPNDEGNDKVEDPMDEVVDETIERKLRVSYRVRKPERHTRNCRCPYPGKNSSGNYYDDVLVLPLDHWSCRSVKFICCS